MAPKDDDSTPVAAIVATVRRDLGPRKGWTQWPGGWRGDIEAALVDAVFSARATYRTASGAGVHRQVTDWMARRKRRPPSLKALAAEIDAAGGPAKWASAFGNSQHSPGRRPSAPGGATKAATVLEAARGLSSSGFDVAGDIEQDNLTEVRHQIRQVPGVGYATANYFLMLLGYPGVKPDTMVHSFIARAVGRKVPDERASDLISEAAMKLQANPIELEHAIWAYEREFRASERTCSPTEAGNQR